MQEFHGLPIRKTPFHEIGDKELCQEVVRLSHIWYQLYNSLEGRKHSLDMRHHGSLLLTDRLQPLIDETHKRSAQGSTVCCDFLAHAKEAIDKNSRGHGNVKSEGSFINAGNTLHSSQAVRALLADKEEPTRARFVPQIPPSSIAVRL